jgi:vacuolar-type H+-ATPase subunit H
MTVEQILDELENLLLEASRVPFTNKRVLEEDDIAHLLDELRERIPHEISEAKRVISDRQRILEDAQREAQNIVDQAKNYIAKMTDENIITKQAHEHAAEIINQTRKEAQELHHDSVSYADEVFKHLEFHLEKVLEVVKQGHNNLHQPKSEKKPNEKE